MGKRFETIEERRQYNRNHYQVNRARGKASDHLCRCGLKAEEWAQRHELDGKSPEDYDPMCRPCHHKYDDRWNESERARVKESTIKVWASSPERRQRMSDHPIRLGTGKR